MPRKQIGKQEYIIFKNKNNVTLFEWLIHMSMNLKQKTWIRQKASSFMLKKNAIHFYNTMLVSYIL